MKSERSVWDENPKYVRYYVQFPSSYYIELPSCLVEIQKFKKKKTLFISSNLLPCWFAVPSTTNPTGLPVVMSMLEVTLFLSLQKLFEWLSEV